MKSAFLLSKGLLCLYDKQNNTWLLLDMEFLFSCSTRRLTRSLRLLVSYRVEHSKRNSISTRTHVLFSIYHLFAWKSAQKVRRENSSWNTHWSTRGNSPACENSKLHKNEVLERFIGIFGVEDTNKILFKKKKQWGRLKVNISIWPMHEIFLKYSICNFSPKLITLCL